MTQDATIRLVGFAGSLRQGSYNRKLLAAAQRLMPADAVLEILPIDVVPLYNGDDEASTGIPRPVAALKEAIAAADGLVIATPEYNGGIPGVAKNVIDWISRPPSDIPRVLYGKPVALMGASPGRLGTALSQAAWLPVLRHLRMRLWTGGGPLYVPSAAQVFDEDGQIVDAEIEERVRSFMASFVDSLRPR
ncbi:MAG: NAD(P)H-dependent oxidoreductase [Gammaproteobacteria bacterium]|nr:NADPH-dependent FMN reductase [Gammaproteobacteria bacterium]